MNDQRQHYRKNIRLTAYLVRGGREQAFQLQDLSLGGIRAHFEEDPQLTVGNEVHIRMPGLRLEGDVMAVRVRPHEDGGFDVGFGFVAMDGVEGNAFRYRAEEPRA